MDDEQRRRRDIEHACEEQRKRSERARKNNDQGRWFTLGMAEMRGETRHTGWQREQPMKLPSGRERKHDNARVVNELGGRDFTEYKSGDKVGGHFTMEQISKDREALTVDPNARGVWVTKRDALDPATRAALEALTRDFRGRFRVEEISPQLARKAIEIGRALERDPNQLELIDSSELRRKQLAKERLERKLAQQRVQEAAQRAVEAQERLRQEQEREHKQREAQELALKRQREAAERTAESARRARAAAARGQREPLTRQEIADILAVSRPTPGIDPIHRYPPTRTRRGIDPRTRGRDRGLDLER